MISLQPLSCITFRYDRLQRAIKAVDLYPGVESYFLARIEQGATAAINVAITIQAQYVPLSWSFTMVA